MRKIILLCCAILLLSGCQQPKKNEYMMFKTNNFYERAYTLSDNEWISDETIEKVKNIPNVEVDDAYILPIYYRYGYENFEDEPNWNNEWHLYVDGVETKNTETGVKNEHSDGDYDYQYYGIAPFKNIKKLESFCTNLYSGEITDYVPIYLSGDDLIKFELEDLDESFDEKILISFYVFLPTKMRGEHYELKQEEVTFQVKGFYNSNGSCVSNFVPLDDMNKLIDDHKEGELKAKCYIVTTDKYTSKKIEKMEEHLFVNPRWVENYGYTGFSGPTND